MSNIKETIEKYCHHLKSCFINRTNSLMNAVTSEEAECTCGLDRVLALLGAEEPKCKTCGDTGNIVLQRVDCPGVDWEPCPDCKAEEPETRTETEYLKMRARELVKRIELIKENANLKSQLQIEPDCDTPDCKAEEPETGEPTKCQQE